MIAHLKLKDKFRLIGTSKGLSKGVINSIKENFDAQNKIQKDEYDIIIATDKLSEGINLNRAGAIINYDIPWNPVRVIQRVGRINRIGKKVYDELYILNFFPTEKGADEIKSVEIAQNKMFMIHNVLGEDSKIFTPDEEPQPSELWSKLNKLSEDEEESFFTRIKKDWEEIRKETPHIEEKIKDIPPRVKISKPHDTKSLIVFVKKNNELFCLSYKYATVDNFDKGKPEEISFEEAYEHIISNPDTPLLERSKDFWKAYKKTIDFKKPYHKPKTTESKAIHKLSFFKEKIKDPFIDALIEAIKEYGLLSNKTLKDIASVSEKNFLKLLEKLKIDWEQTIKDITQNKKHEEKEVIIAIENLTI